MIEVDDSELTEDEREFLECWAKALHVSRAVLIIRILSAAIDGDQYTAWTFELMFSRNWGHTPESILSLLRKIKRQIQERNLAEGRPKRGEMEAWVIDLKA